MIGRHFHLARTIVGLVVLLVVSTSTVSVSAQPVVGLAAQLLGTWKLVKYVDTDASGKITYRFGEQPLGYFVYDPTGHLSIQIMRMPPRPAFESADDDNGTNDEVRTAYNAYVAYFGTYRVDEQRHIVTHIVEGSLKPSYTGTEQPRPFKLNGDTLVIEISDKKGGHHYRELHRVK